MHREGMKFLEYAAKARGRLLLNLKKGAAADADLAEDIIQDCILKIYRLITEHGLKIKNYENYFSKIAIRDYREAVRRQKRGGHVAHGGDSDEEAPPAPAILQALRDRVERAFGKEPAAVYFAYMKAKAERKKCSYREYAKETGIPVHHIVDVGGRISRWIRREGLNRLTDGMDKQT